MSASANSSSTLGKPRQGTSNKGPDYEIHLSTFISLNFYDDPTIEDFSMWSNITNFGCFDDVVVTLQTTASKMENYAIQVKHKENQNLNINPPCLEIMTKHDFGLFHYCKNYFEIDNRDNYNYIIYTNAFPDKNKLNTLTKLDIKTRSGCPGKKHFFTDSAGKGKIYNFEVNSETQYAGDVTEAVYKSFLSKFAFYAHQSNWREIKKLVFEKFWQMFQAAESVAMGYIEIFKLWKLHEYTNVKITKKELTIKIFDLILSPHVITPSAGTADKRFALLEEAFKKFDFSITNGLAEDKLSQAQLDPSEDVLRLAKELKFLTKDVTTDNFVQNAKLQEETRHKIACFKKEHPMVIKIHETNKASIVATLLKLKSKDDKLHFVLNGEQIDGADLPGFTTFINLSDLFAHERDLYHKIIQQCRIKLLNGTYSYGELFGDDQEVAKTITIKDMYQMLAGNFRIEVSLEDLPKPYISRCLLVPALKLEPIDEINDDLIVITYPDNIKIEELLQKNLVKRSSMQVDEYLKKTNVDSTKLVLFKDKLSKDLLDQICAKNPTKNIHHLEVYHDEYLKWISTKGKIEELKKCEIAKKSPVKESNIHESLQNCINVIVARRGMGKSELLKKLKNTCPSGLFPIKINLKEHGSFFNLNHSSEEILEYFLRHPNDCFLLTKAKHSFAERKKIFFCFDGLDELPVKNTNCVLDCVKKLSSMGFKLWLSSAPNLLEVIENHLDVFTMEMASFNQEQQKDYINVRLKGKKNLDETIKHIFANIETIVEKREILDVPLQLFMITEILREHAMEVPNNLFLFTKMFEHFISGRYRHFFNKSNCSHLGSLEEILQDSKIYRMEQYQIAALKSCLDQDEFERLNLKHNKKFLKQIENEGDFLGFISRTVENVVIFNHNIHAEYFAAVWLAENCFDIQDVLKEIFFKEKYHRIRFMFDLILAEDFPAHIAILYRSITDLELHKSRIGDIDKGGRTTLQLACSQCSYPIIKDSHDEVVNYEAISSMRQIDNECRKILKCLLDERQDPLAIDSLFSWNSWKYADKSVFLLPLEIFLEKYGNQHSVSNLELFKHHKWTLLFYSALFSYTNLFSKTYPASSLKTDKVKRLLSIAITCNSWKIVKIMLDHGVDIESTTRNSRTPLHVASLNGHVEIVVLLLFKGANINACDQYSRTALHLAAANGHIHTIKELFKYHPAVDPVDKYGRTPLHLAVEKGHQSIVALLLNQKLAQIDEPAFNGWTPLHLAVVEGHESIVEMLLDRGALFDKIDEYGTKPIHIAAKRRSLKILQTLLEKTQNLEDLTNDGRTMLHLTAEFGNIEGMKYLLEKGANVNAVDQNGRSVLHWAVLGGRVRVVKLLLTQDDVNVDFVDNNGRNCLQWAAELGQMNIVEELLKKMGGLINNKANNGCTALHWAASNGFDGIVKLLLDKGADINITNNDGQSALYWAAVGGHLQTVQLLVDKNADDVLISGYGALEFAKNIQK